MLRLAEGVILNLIITTYPFLPFILLQVTPTANRNSYRVARLVGAVTQGSVLCPQPWAGESQLRQSCCCLRAAVCMYPLHCCCLRAAVCMYSFRCCYLRAAVCMYPLHCCCLWAAVCMYSVHCCCLRAAVCMYSFRCCSFRAALHMYSLRCCRLEGPGCVSHPPFIASIRG